MTKSGEFSIYESVTFSKTFTALFNLLTSYDDYHACGNLDIRKTAVVFHSPFLIAIRFLCNFCVQDHDSLVTSLLQVIPHRFSARGKGKTGGKKREECSLKANFLIQQMR